MRKMDLFVRLAFKKKENADYLFGNQRFLGEPLALSLIHI